MIKKLFLSTILGGIIAFAWLSLSWMFLGLHQPTLNEFKDEAAVTTAIKDNVTHSGIYVLPYRPADLKAETPDEEKSMLAEIDKKLAQGPYLFASVTLEGTDPQMKQQMLYGFLSYLGAAFLMSLLLAFVSCLSFFKRFSFVVILSVLLALLAESPGYIWWHFSESFVIANIIDVVAAWVLAGFVMAAIVKKPKQAE